MFQNIFVAILCSIMENLNCEAAYDNKKTLIVKRMYRRLISKWSEVEQFDESSVFSVCKINWFTD